MLLTLTLALLILPNAIDLVLVTWYLDTFLPVILIDTDGNLELSKQLGGRKGIYVRIGVDEIEGNRIR